MKGSARETQERRTKGLKCLGPDHVSPSDTERTTRIRGPESCHELCTVSEVFRYYTTYSG